LDFAVKPSDAFNVDELLSLIAFEPLLRPSQWSFSAKVRIWLFCQSFRPGLTEFSSKPSDNGLVSSSIWDMSFDQLF